MTNEEILIKGPFNQLYNKYLSEDFYQDRTGQKYIELIGTNFELDPMQPILEFNGRKTPLKYAKAEIEWYNSQSLSVEYIKQYAKLWDIISDEDGMIHSNYGWCIYSDENYNQYECAIRELIQNKDTRRAAMIYTRPSIQVEYNRKGMNDFICTYSTNHLIRNNILYYTVNMRSNDSIWGFFSDFYWHCHVYQKMYNELLETYPDLKTGSLIWMADSFHLYERHFETLKDMMKTEF
jgi:thymidylate synthase